MNRPRHCRARSHGLSLIELIVTLSLMAVLMAPVVGLLRLSSEVWEAYDSDHTRLDALQATMQHLLGQLRQADSIVSITDASSTAGVLQARLGDGNVYEWRHRGDQVLFGRTVATELLADGITELTFVGYEKDGVTPTTVPGRIQVVECVAKVRLDREVAGEKTSRCRVWLRPW